MVSVSGNSGNAMQVALRNQLLSTGGTNQVALPASVETGNSEPSPPLKNQLNTHLSTKLLNQLGGLNATQSQLNSSFPQFQKLPLELQTKVFSHCDARTLAMSRLTNFKAKHQIDFDPQCQETLKIGRATAAFNALDLSYGGFMIPPEKIEALRQSASGLSEEQLKAIMDASMKELATGALNKILLSTIIGVMSPGMLEEMVRKLKSHQESWEITRNVSTLLVLAGHVPSRVHEFFINKLERNENNKDDIAELFMNMSGHTPITAAFPFMSKAHCDRIYNLVFSDEKAKRIAQNADFEWPGVKDMPNERERWRSPRMQS
jgi:hypothetical protein